MPRENKIIEKILRLAKKVLPNDLTKKIRPFYHYGLAFLGALFSGFPSRNLIVIGVTGTKGKTTTANLIAHILESSGHKTGLTTTVNFKIGGQENENYLKQTMPGRFKLQKFLREMTNAGCVYAVVETSSEGIAQFRHKFLNYQAAVFLNISPEHIERHGGFENYRAAKLELFKAVARKTNGIGVYNLDDDAVEFFISPKIKNRFGFSFSGKTAYGVKPVFGENLRLSGEGLAFNALGESLESSLLGKFNAENCLAAITATHALGIDTVKIKTALKSFQGVPGRFEIIKKKGLTAVIDYAHEPASLKAAYQAVSETKLNAGGGKTICLLGGQGGGRDKWKRPEMGRIASEHCDRIILTNEDPYDEDPKKILDDIAKGVPENQKENIFQIIDRREAIEKAVSLARQNDVIIFTGKGGEKSMCVENGKKIPWDEKKVVLEILEKKAPEGDI